MQVENRKIVIINKTAASPNKAVWQIPIKVDFKADEMVVRSGVYHDNADYANVTVQSDMMVDPIAVITDIGVSQGPQTIHRVRGPIDGTYTFTLLDAAGAPKVVTVAAAFGLTLEFIKYK